MDRSSKCSLESGGLLDVGEDFRATLSPRRYRQRRRTTHLHSLRHGFASLLIANNLNVVYVSRQLGHANVNITLEVAALESSHGAVGQDT